MGGDSTVLQHYLAPLQALLDPGDVTDLVVNRPGELAIEQAGAWRWLEAPELTPAWLSTLATSAAAYTSQDVNTETPICSTVLPRGETPQPAADSKPRYRTNVPPSNPHQGRPKVRPKDQFPQRIQGSLRAEPGFAS